MAPRPRWWRILGEARRQACVAIDFYNRAGDKRSFLDFVVHMHLAWQYLLHGDRERRGENIYYREHGRYVRGADGEKRTWDLQRCLKEELPQDSPVRLNVEFFIGLRNKIEHRYQDALLIATAAHAHALVVNFETELVSRFGEESSLAHELRFPVFVQSLTPEGIVEQRKLRRRLPAAASGYITKFENTLPAEVRDDSRFTYRVQLLPMKGPRTEADMAFNFVTVADLNDDDRRTYEAQGKTGLVLVAEKTRDVALRDEMLPKATAAAIQDRLPFRFSMNDFIVMWKKHGVRPPRGVPNPEKTETRYCIYVKATNNYVYTPAYVERCVRELDTESKFEAAIGRKPVLKAPRR